MRWRLEELRQGERQALRDGIIQASETELNKIDALALAPVSKREQTEVTQKLTRFCRSWPQAVKLAREGARKQARRRARPAEP
eukprot:670139-Pleurochrysis_carterae.AAC.1